MESRPLFALPYDGALTKQTGKSTPICINDVHAMLWGMEAALLREKPRAEKEWKRKAKYSIMKRI